MNIDITKKYKTRDGRDVIAINIVLTNLIGEKVTFPIKGSIIEKGKRSKYNIWQLDGKSSIWGDTPEDLVEQ